MPLTDHVRKRLHNAFPALAVCTQHLRYLFCILPCVVLLSCGDLDTPPPRAENGVLDLRDWDFKEDGAVPLEGTWVWYDQALINPHELKSDSHNKEADFYEVPKSWTQIGDKSKSSNGYATYWLTLQLRSAGQLLSLEVPSLGQPYQVWVDGQLILRNGHVRNRRGAMDFESPLRVVSFSPKKTTVEMVVKISNHHQRAGGIWKSFILGDHATIRQNRESRMVRDMCLFGSQVFLAFYFIGAFAISKDRDNDYLFWFGMMCLTFAVRDMFAGDRWLSGLIPFFGPWLDLQMGYTGVYLGIVFIFKFYQSLFPKEFNHYLIRALVYLGMGLVFFVIITPPWIFTGFGLASPIMAMIAALVCGSALVQAAIKKRPHIYPVLAGSLFCFVTALIESWFYTFSVEKPVFRIGFAIMSVSVAVVLASRIAATFKAIETVSQDLEKKNQTLLANEKLQDRFLAHTCYELHMPLNGMLALANGLVEDKEQNLPGDARRSLLMIANCCDRLSNLVNEILEFTRLSSGDIILHRKEIDLYETMNGVLLLSRPLLGNKKIALMDELPESLPTVLADENRLQQVLHNLIGNAIKFTEEGWVVVTAKAQESKVLISVEDSGMGIPEKNWRDIFRSFRQVDGRSDRQFGGAGLGLAVTRHLVELLGGEIWVESKPGSGSKFFFTLPIFSEATLQGAEQSSQNRRTINEPTPPYRTPQLLHPQSPDEIMETVEQKALDVWLENSLVPLKSRILVVEGSPVYRQALLNYLFREGLTLVAVSCAQEAIQTLHEETFDLVLCDTSLPDGTGFQLCTELRKEYPKNKLPVIFLSDKNQPEDLIACFESGGNDFMGKPIIKNELLVRVSLHLQLQHTYRTLDTKVNDQRKTLASYNYELERLGHTIKAINKEFAFKPLLRALLDQAMSLYTGAMIGIFLFRDRNRGYFSVAAAVGKQAQELEGRNLDLQHVETDFLEGAQRLDEGIYLVRPEKHPVVIAPGLTLPPAMLSLTVQRGDLLEGLLLLCHQTDPDAFENVDLFMMQRFHVHAVAAVKKARLLEAIHLRNKELQASLAYAQHIQDVLLFQGEGAAWAMPHFVLFQPKDLVSGDFYWSHRGEEGFLMVVADCTGHGVRGAFMTLIGRMLLDEIVVRKNLMDPAKILDQLDEGIRRVCKESEHEDWDGMDMAVCRLSSTQKSLTFAGAYSPLYIVPSGGKRTRTIKGTRRAVGGRPRKKPRAFSNTFMPIGEGDMIYLASDGFADQGNVVEAKFGRKRFCKELAKIASDPLETQKSRLSRILNEFVDQAPQRDDITVLGMRIDPPKHEWSPLL